MTLRSRSGWLVVMMTLLATGLAGCQAPGEPTRREREAAALTRAGERHLAQGLTDEALAAFDQALRRSPDHVPAWMGLGAARHERGELDEAAQAYERARAIDPQQVEAHYRLGYVRELSGDLPAAERAYLAALTLAPDRFDPHHRLALVLLRSGRSGEALQYAQIAVRIEPGRQDAWISLGAAHQLAGDPDEAIFAYRVAMEVGPPAEPIFLGLAAAHIEAENWDRAAATLEGMARQFDVARAHERLGFVRFKQERYADARDAYRQAVARDGNDTASLNGLGVSLMAMYLQTNQRDLALRDQALVAWRRSLARDPRQPRIIDLLRQFQRK